MPYQTLVMGPWSGLNQDENPHALRDDELVLATNCAARGKLVGTRPGAVPLSSGEDYENALTSNPSVQGAFEYRNGYDQNRSLIVIADNAAAANRHIWFEDADQLPAGPTLTDNDDYFWSFANHNDLLWAAGGPAGRSAVQTEPTWTWDGDTATAAIARTLTDKGTGATLYPKYVKSWNGYLCQAGLQQTPANRTASNNPAVTRYANFATDPTDDANWPDSNTIGFNPARAGFDTYGGTYSTGLGEYRDNEGDFLMLLFNTHIAAAVLDPGSDFRVVDGISNGCVGQRAYVNLGPDSGDAIYVSDVGVHSVRQSQQHGVKEDAFLSWKIRSFWQTLNRQRMPFTCGAYDARNGRVLFAFTTGSDTSHSVIMALEIKDLSGPLTADTARWFGPWRIVDTSQSDNIARIAHMGYYRRESDDEWFVYVFTTDGRVLRFDEDIYQDLGLHGYTIELQTKHYLGDTINEKRIGDSMQTVGPNGDHLVQTKAIFDLGRKSSQTTVKLKSAGGFTLDVSQLDVDKLGSDFSMAESKVSYRGKGRTIGLQWTHNGAGEPFLIGRAATQVLGAGEGKGDED